MDSAGGEDALVGLDEGPETSSPLGFAWLEERGHRFANLLQLICGSLDRQMRDVPDVVAKSALFVACQQIRAVGALHQVLDAYSGGGPDALARDMESVCSSLETIMLSPRGHSLTLSLSDDAIGLRPNQGCRQLVKIATTEFIINSAKHALHDDANGEIRVSLRRSGSVLVLAVADNGSASSQPTHQANRRGMRLIQSLVEQVGGSCRWAFGSSGTLAELHLPIAGVESQQFSHVRSSDEDQSPGTRF